MNGIHSYINYLEFSSTNLFLDCLLAKSMLWLVPLKHAHFSPFRAT